MLILPGFIIISISCFSLSHDTIWFKSNFYMLRLKRLTPPKFRSTSLNSSSSLVSCYFQMLGFFYRHKPHLFFMWEHLLGIGRTQQKMYHPCLTTPFVSSRSLPLSLHSSSLHSSSPPSTSISLTPRCNLLPGRVKRLVDECGWSLLWGGNGAVCSAIPLRFLFSIHFHSSLPLFKPREPGGSLCC